MPQSYSKENSVRSNDNDLARADLHGAFVGLLQGFKIKRADAEVLSQHSRVILKLINRKKEPLRETGLKRLAAISRRDGIAEKEMAVVLDLVDRKRLNTTDLSALQELVEKGPKRAEVVIRVLRAVSISSPNREREALQRLAHHNGSFSVLEKYLVAMDTDDLFKAADRSQILMASEEIIREHAKDFKVEIVEGENIPDKVTTASGQHATSARIFFIQDMLPPGYGIACGEMATTHLTETLRGQAPQGKVLEKKKSDRKRRAHEQFEHLGLEDLLADPSLIEQIKSPLVGRKLRVFKELEAEVTRLRNEVEGFLDDEGLARIASLLNRLQLQDDPSGMMDSYLQNQAKVGKLPDAIQLAYDNLNHPLTELQPDEEAYLRRALLVYQVHHSFIAERVSVTPFLDDLTVWNDLPSEDPLKEQFAEQFAAIKPQLAAFAERQVLSLPEFSEFLTTAGLFEFRSQVNQRVWQTFQQEVRDTVTRFNKLLFRTKTGSWREDCITLSVPERIKSTFYGAKIGVETASKIDDPSAKRSTLTGDELRHIMFMSVNLDACPDDRRILRSTPIKNFRDRIDSIISAARKVDYLDMAWHHHQRSQAGRGLTTTEGFDPNNVGEGVKDWTPVLILGRKTPGEHLEHQVGLSAQEIVNRVTARLDLLPTQLRLEWKKHQEGLVREASVNLYSDNRDESLLRRASKFIADLTPANEIGEDLERAKEIGRCPLVYRLAGHSTPEEWVSQKYFSAAEVEDVRNGASGYQKFVDLGLADVDHVRRLSASIKKYQAVSFYVGQADGGVLALSNPSFEELFGSVHDEKRLFSYRSPAEIADRVGKVDRLIEKGQWVKTTTALTEDWLERARVVCSNQGIPALSAHKLDRVNVDTFRNAKRLIRSDRVYINKEFVELIDEILPNRSDLAVYQNVSATSHAKSIISRQKEFAIRAGEVVVNFGQRHRNQSAIQVALDKPSYFSNFMQGGQFSDTAKQIAMEAVKITKVVRGNKNRKEATTAEELTEMNQRLLAFVEAK